MKVVVTGASGFIGHAMMEKFSYEGYITVGWDVHNKGDDKIRIVDMLNNSDIEHALWEDKPDIIIHCAGNASVGSSFEDVQKDYNLNVTVTHDLLFTLNKYGLNQTKVVFLSSASVYGNPSIIPITENALKKPISPYALHKSMCEDICFYFITNYNFNIKIARIFSAYGNGLRKQVFWDMYQKYKKNGIISMFGSGMESRDFIHIDDLKNAIYLIATKEFSEHVINVANNEEVTIKAAADLFSFNIDIKHPKVIFNGEVRTGDPNNWNANIDLLKQLGYTKKVSIENGIAMYCNWVKSL